jgi:hypothetical protein
MAFDEGYHFGLIQLFSHSLNPIISHQDSTTYTFGAVIQNPSFLYHYLMSFPYRLVSHYSSSLEVQVLFLRFINLSFAVASLVIARALLVKLKLPKSIVNISILAFALTPIVTVLSAQINYDNLLILSTASALYMTTIFVEQLKKNVFNVRLLLSLICLCLFASLVKYSFLPVFLGIGIVLSIQLLTRWRKDRASLLSEVSAGYKAVTKRSKAILAVFAIVGTGLFINFYGVNLVRYHNPVPQCNQVLSISDCKQYYAWDRNYTVAQYAKSHGDTTNLNVLRYTSFWIRVEYYQLFAEIVPTGGLVSISRAFYIVIMSLSAFASICLVLNVRKIFDRYKALPVVTVVSLTYLAALWLRNYHDYQQLGQPLAIQGRYLLPVLIFVYVLMGLGVKTAFESKRKTKLVVRPVFAIVAITAFLYFGGFVRYASTISPTNGWNTSGIENIPHYKVVTIDHLSISG